jgi:NADH dehydrogenase
MKKVIIIGAGFAGITALKKLSSYKGKEGLEVTLINDKEKASFLPLLPDCLGRNINPEHLSFDLTGIISKRNFNFVKDKVIALDLEKKEVKTSSLSLSFDYLVISSGTETNFYGNNEIRDASFKLDDAQDAMLIRKALDEKDFSSYMISGAGYTGIEVATNLSVYLRKNKKAKRLVIVERAPSILGPLPQWMKDYVIDNLKRLNIEVLVNTSIEKIEAGAIQLSDSKVFENSMLIWASGVRTADFIQNLKLEKNAQGRIKTDEYLRINDFCFAAGDTAYFSHKSNFLRMAVQFAIMEGNAAALNVIKSIEGGKLVKYTPVDLGYIVPMANNRACGVTLGVNMKGFLPIILHYAMCIYRAYTLRNKLDIIKDLFVGMRGAK